MIRKPPPGWGREAASVTNLRRAAVGGAAAARAGSRYARGVVCWGFALLWGFAALAGGLVGGSLPTFLGVGAMALAMAWSGARLFAGARGRG